MSMMRSFLRLAAGAALLTVAVPFVSIQSASAKPIVCPDTWVSLQCDYYKDGYKAGRQDRKANMSMFYGRHSDAYDSRFEENYRVGYEDGWQGK